MKLYVLRHAHSIGNEMGIIDSIEPKYDKGLSNKGLKQAEELVPKLKQYNFDLFIVSPLSRTLQTIQPYLKKLDNPEVIISELSLERNAGDFIGKKKGYSKIYMKEHNVENSVSFRFPNGESVLDVYERTKKFLDNIKNKYPNKNILLCGHSVFLKCLDILIKGKDIQDYPQTKSLENAEIREYNI